MTKIKIKIKIEIEYKMENGRIGVEFCVKNKSDQTEFPHRDIHGQVIHVID